MHKHTYRNSYLAYFLVYNFYYLSWAMFSCLISVYLMGKGYKAADVSLVVSISYLASLIAQPFVGELSDRYSVKKVNVISLILAMIGSEYLPGNGEDCDSFTLSLWQDSYMGNNRLCDWYPDGWLAL